MVPEITHPKSISRALNYNENKVQKGQAELIEAGNFLKNPEEMNFHEKLERFTKQMELNQRAGTKVIHISLNFHPSETERMTPDFLRHLSREYMEKMGFGNQPYLVYQHKDAAHPHVHIVSTLIKEDGRRIPTHNLGKNVSEPIRKEMEQTYRLVKADKKKYSRQQEQHLAVNVQKVLAGKTDVKRGIQNVLDHVIDRYNYTSIHELNALLKQYNVQASRGEETSRVYQNRGLLYAIIDENDKRVAKPVKASVFYNKPTLDYIEGKFEQNKQQRSPDHKKHLKNAIDWAMLKNPESLTELSQALKKERIDMVVRRNPEGRVYGLTYVDHEAKAVFNGSDLGKDYSPKRMLERLGKEQQAEQDKSQQQQRGQQKDPALQTGVKEAKPPQQKDIQKEPDRDKQTEPSVAGVLGEGLSRILQDLLQPDNGNESLNSELKKDEEKRRRRNRSLDREL
jgi:hypothetical protein